MLADGADAGMQRRPVTVKPERRHPPGRGPAIDSLDPQRSYLPGVWNLMRLYTRTLVTYSSEPGATDRAACPTWRQTWARRPRTASAGRTPP